MASSSLGGRGLSFSIGGLSPRGERPSDDVLHILVIADCSGRRARGVCEPLAGRRAQSATIERLERLMQGWRARARTPLLEPSGEPFWFVPESLDDFHPEQLLRAAAPLVELMALRGALETDASAAARLAELLEATRPVVNVPHGAASIEDPAPQAAAGAAPPDHPRVSESGSDMLARLLGGEPAAASGTAPSPRAPARPAASKVDLDRFIRAIVAGASDGGASQSGSSHSGGPHSSAPRASVEALAALASAAEAELGRRLRCLLAAPALRALEATWRGIDGLCRHNPDDERVRVSVLDASFEELEASPDALGALLDAAAPTVLLLDHVFTPARDPLRALAALLETCHQRDVSVLAGAHAHLAGCAHFNEVSRPEEHAVDLPEEGAAAWADVLRARERGARLGLALPRYLLRQPYGAAGEPIEPFPFEEILDASQHEAFSWGNGAYLIARALGIEHAGERGVHPDGSIDVRDLPVVYLEGDGSGGDQSRIKPNAEAWLSERSLGRLRAAGFSVLLGLRDTDRIRVYP